ncbi:DNA-3-methyladenine glycosylase [Galactobacter caseinivorans]|uniref:DNA-3-methyladenine glycosylase n=1 Tax=Galactobacter caseinivorans TaxID=2676123 RepID=UPI001F3287A7|nr:DNA-3-methyladenine glycosylase [Galactobacter caseinivorans]
MPEQPAELSAVQPPDPRWAWLDVPVEEAARRLLGCRLISEVGGDLTSARIVETEAYSPDDPASHTFRGPNKRNAAMFLGAGHAYVYLSHGIHSCLNIVSGRAGAGCGVLIRAVEPLEGGGLMRLRRGGRDGVELSNGPGKLGQALGINLGLTGHDLQAPPLRLLRGAEPPRVVVTTRIGISKGVELPRRFYDAESRYVSKYVRA